MSDFKYFDLSKSVKKASILAYSILLHKTYKNVGQDIPEYLESEIKYFYERVKCKLIPYLNISIFHQISHQDFHFI